MNDNRAKIKALREEKNLTYKEIAVELKLSTSYVQVLNGSDGRRGGIQTQHPSPDEHLRQNIKFYFDKELPPKIIAKIVDLPVAQVRYHLRRLGLTKNRTYSNKGENETLFLEGQRRCGNCNLVKNLSEFPKHQLGAHGLLGTCRACRNKQYVERRAATPSVKTETEAAPVQE